MIKLSKEVHAVMQKLENAGYETYVTGECVMEAIMGNKPENWLIVTETDREKIREIAGFECLEPDGITMSIQSINEPIDSYLCRQPFTALALADNPVRRFVDPFGGKSDIASKQIKATRDPHTLFKEDPLKIMEAICLVSATDFNIEAATFEAMQANASALKSVDFSLVRKKFDLLLDGRYGGKALRMAVAAGVMDLILGEECYPPKSKYEASQLATLMENLDDCIHGQEFRYALLFLCFERNLAGASIRRMRFDPAMTELLIDAHKQLEDLHFASDKIRFKKLLGKLGRERYEYLHKLSKAQRKVYDHPEYRILSRHYMMEEFESLKIPVFLEDLAVSGQDLVDAGIVTPDKAEEMRRMLLDVVHKHPWKNKPEELFKIAAGFQKNPLKAALRGVVWFK